MSKISALGVILFASLLGWGKSEAVEGKVLRKNNEFSVLAKDKKGLTREYSISNSADIVYDVLRLEGKPVRVKGIFENKGSRSGTVEVKEIEEDQLDPLQAK